ncbi:unnamed protein product [Penicillium manginii]
MGFKTFLALATLGLAAAESSVVLLFMAGFGFNPEDPPQSFTGSIVAVTVVDAGDCAYLTGLLYTAGPTLVKYAMETPHNQYGTVPCLVGDIAPESVVCAIARVTITGGATKTPTGSSATKTDESSQATNSGDSISQTANKETSTSYGGSASQMASGSASASTGGIPGITAVPGIVLGSAAAAFMAAAW